MVNVFEQHKAENEKGKHVRLSYRNRDVLIFEHCRDNPVVSEWVLNYNVFIPSSQLLLFNFGHAWDFLEKLRKRNARNVNDAIEEAGLGNTRHGLLQQCSNIQAWISMISSGPDRLPLDCQTAERYILEREYQATQITRGQGSVLIEDYSEHPNPFAITFPYNLGASLFLSQIRINAFDADVAGELSNLVSNVGAVKIEEGNLKELEKSLEQVLSEFTVSINR